MYIKKIILNNFRNYKNQEIELNENINIIYGNNAQGKTNILESIFLCAMGKSFREKKDSNLINFSENRAKVIIEYEKNNRKRKLSVEIDDKKTFYINDIKQNKISDIIGKINVVIFTPDDIEIIKEGPQKRRKFLDMMISSLKPNYIYILNNYNKVLEQRNNYLKQINKAYKPYPNNTQNSTHFGGIIKSENKNQDLLDVWDEQIAELSFKIYEYRKSFIEKIAENIKDIHNSIIKCGKEDIKIKYISNGDSKEKFLENIRKTRQLDIKRGFTATGIHRDDFIIYINGKQVSIFGSQGQQRTTVLTLKLCELKIVKEEIQDYPILLLDDFMSELDENRRKSFLENIKGNQVILTCTDKIEIGNNSKTYFIENGICKKV